MECGGGDLRVESMPLLVQALRWIKWEQAGIVKRTSLPITPVLLEQLWSSIQASEHLTVVDISVNDVFTRYLWNPSLPHSRISSDVVTRKRVIEYA